MTLKNIKIDDINYFEYDNFSNIEEIGKGAFGVVSKATWNDNGIKVALKSLLNNGEKKENFIKELKFLLEINIHPNVNRFLGITQDPVRDNYIIILQYANQGNLREYLKENFPLLRWKDKIKMALDITCGLKYIHSKKIIHRDLHSKNILVHNGSSMIADFGSSKHSAEIIESDSEVLGMAAYIEPQCFINNNHKKNEKSDIYSLGVLFWEISSGKPPFHGISEFKIAVDIVRGIRETPIDNTPFEYQQLYEKCWKEEPNQRPDIDEIYRTLNQLQSPFDKSKRIIKWLLIVILKFLFIFFFIVIFYFILT